jgi:transcriptional regulator with XRE-family HTH domain
VSDIGTINRADNERDGFAKRLHARMEELDTDRAKLAQLTGAHRNQVGEWLRAEHWPSAQHLLAISRQLGVSIDWLLSGSEPVAHAAAAEHAALSLAGELARLAPSLTDLARRAEGLARAGRS